MPKNKPNPRDGWRISAGYPADPVDEMGNTGFDELRIGKWFHIERMDMGYWWLRLGDKTTNVKVDAKGNITVMPWVKD